MATEFIKPGAPLIPGYTKLPPLDQVEGRFIVPPVLVFRVDSPDAQDSIVQDLKDGLAITIEEMPFIASHVIPDNKERGTIQLEIVEDAGVWFHVKEIPELNFEELELRNFSPSCFSVMQLMAEPRQHSWERSPVITIQANFITGGLLVVFNAHHSVMDGRGMAVFGKTWGKNVEAVSAGLVPEAFKQESLDRTPVFSNINGSMQLSDFPNYRISKTGLRSDKQRELLQAALATGDLSHPALRVLQNLHLSYWNISQTALQAIKQVANASAPNAEVLTDSAILSALLWRHITRARQLVARGIVSTCLLNVVNVCRRLDPPLPLDYPGNALTHAKTVATSTDVESEKSLYDLAKQCSDAIDWWTSERIWGFIGAVDSTPHVGKVEPAMDNFLGPDLEITNSGSFGEIMRLTWGPDLGKVICLRFPYAPIYDGWINVLPSRENGPVELLIALDKTTGGRLCEDQEWAAFAEQFK